MGDCSSRRMTAEGKEERKRSMKEKRLLKERAMSVALSAAMIISMVPSGFTLAATQDEPVYAAVYQGASTREQTTLPDTVLVNGEQTAVEWSIRPTRLSVPYTTTEVSGTTEDGDTVQAQVEVIPAEEHELVYFVDSGLWNAATSVAFDAVSKLTGDTLKNQVADQTYDAASGWGRVGSNFVEKKTDNVDVTKKMQTGWYSSSKTEPLVYQYELEPGTYTLTAGFYEWWNNRSVKVQLSGKGLETITSEAVSVSGIGSSDEISMSFEVDAAGPVTMEVQNATGGEAPVISWFAVAKGEVAVPEGPAWEEDIIVDGNDVDEAAQNKNGLTYKGFGLLSGNSTSNLLMDYKDQNPQAYEEMLEVLFGGAHPLISHIKMEMGNDGNNSTGADSCTMRFENEEADVSRSPGFQLAADAKKINPAVKVSFLRWGMPAWVAEDWNRDRTGAGYESMYTWYRETVFDAYEKYGYVVDYINPDTNETSDPDEAFIKWFRNRVSSETEFPDYMNQAAREAYHNIRIIASDENTTLNIVPSMRADAELYDAVDAIGFHYRAGDETSTADYRNMADKDDKEVWYSEGCATFSYTEYQENKTDAYGGGTIGGYQSPLALADNFVKSFVYSRKTHYIFQPGIGSFYEGAQYDHKEILSAREPWAGYVHYDPVIYMLEHFTKFAKVGWESEDNTSGIWRVIPSASANNSTGSDHLRNEAGNPSYMTLAAPDKRDFSVVMVNNSEKTVSYRVKPEHMNLAEHTAMEIWETKTDSYLRYRGEADLEDGYYLVTVEPYSMVTLTTLDCDGEPEYTTRLPEEGDKAVLDTDADGEGQNTEDGILYADDFEYQEEREGYLENRGNEPRYMMDFSGAFVVEDGQMKQLLNQSVSQWNNNAPSTVVGDFRWANYKASVDVTVAEGGYAGINIRQQTGMNFEGSGYNLQITDEGVWTLKKRATTLESGRVPKQQNRTYHLSLEGKGNRITAWINGEEVCSYVDDTPEYFGRVRLGCGWAETAFDNLVIEKVDGYLPYAAAMIDNAADEVIYDESWNIVAGGGGGSNDWYRSTSTNTGAQAVFTFMVNGDGFALIGGNDGSAVLDVTVDGESKAQGTSTQSSNQHASTYMLSGLGEGAHQVQVAVTAGTLVLDAIYVLPYMAPDKTSLNAQIAKAEGIAYDSEMVKDTWNTLSAALEKAKEISGAEHVSQEEINMALEALEAAMEGLQYTYTIVDVEEVYAAIDVTGEHTLPETVLCETAAGNQVEKAVAWDLAGISLDAYSRILVYGRIQGDNVRVRAQLEVVPENLKYFIDSGAGQEGEAMPYEMVRTLFPNLKNDKADQVYTAGTWGYDASTVNIRDTAGADQTDKAATGLWALGNGNTAVPITYILPLEPGEYQVTAGFREWWQGPRTMEMTASWTDAGGQKQTAVLAEGIRVESGDPNRVAGGTFTLDIPAEVRIVVTMTSGTEAPVISWLGVAAAVDKEQLRTVVENVLHIEGENYTEDSYAAFAEALQHAREILEDEKASQKSVDAAQKALEDALANLTEKPSVDKEALKAVIQKAQSLNAGNYTSDSYAGVTAALRVAQEVLLNVRATQEEVNGARAALENAIANLKEEAGAAGQPSGQEPQPDQTKIQLAAPAVKSVKSLAVKNGSRVKIIFSKVTNADTYTVYRKVGKKVKKIGTTSGSSVQDKNPASGKKAIYYAIATSKDVRYTQSQPGKSKAITLAKNTSMVKAKRSGKQVTVTFKKVKGARGYLIYRSAKKNGTYVRLTKKPVKKLQYTDKKVKAKKTYYYKVVTFGKNKTYSAGKVSGKVKR